MTSDSIPTSSELPEIDVNILGALRQSAEYSIDEDARLLDFFNDVHESCAETIADFIGEEVSVSERSVEMLKLDLSTKNLDDDDKLYGNVVGDEEQLLFIFVSTQPDFKRLLQLVLSGEVDEEKLGATGPLSTAENKLLLRVYNQLSECLFEKYEMLSNRGVPRRPVGITSQTFSALSEMEEFTQASMEFCVGETKISIGLFLPFDLISTPAEVVFTSDELQEKNKDERIWKETLRKSIEILPVNLEAELVSADLSLDEVSRLAVGDRINLSFGQKQIPLSYDDGARAFLARTELQGTKLLLRVTSGA